FSASWSCSGVMRFSLRRSSPMRTAISESHSRPYGPPAFGVGTAARRLPFDVEPVVQADAHAGSRGTFFETHSVETRTTPDADTLPPQPLLGTDGDHPSLAGGGRIPLHIGIDRQNQRRTTGMLHVDRGAHACLPGQRKGAIREFRLTDVPHHRAQTDRSGGGEHAG